MIYIVIPVFNRVAFTLNCLRSLREQTYKHFTVILVNDGSTDGTTEAVKASFPEVVILEGDGNCWWTKATNEGVKKALELSQSPDDYILTLNNDLVVGADYLEQLIKVAAENGKYITGSMSVSDADPAIIEFSGVKWDRYFGGYNYLHKQGGFQSSSLADTIPTDLLPGRGVLFPIGVFKKAGFFDEKRFPHYMGDEDFSLVCRKAGYELVVSKKAIVYCNLAATGVNNVYQRVSLPAFLKSLRSIRSSNNLAIRWRWAWKHAFFPPVYFLLDAGRVLFSYRKNIFR